MAAWPSVVEYINKHPIYSLMGIVTTFAGFIGLFVSLYLWFQPTPPPPPAERVAAETSVDEDMPPPMPRFQWGLVYFYDGNAKSIYGKGHTYSGQYKIDGLTGPNLYANMKVYFYGVENNALYEWNAPVEGGFLNSYSGTPTQEFGVSMLPMLTLICMEYDDGNERKRIVSSFMRDSMTGSNVFFNEAGPSRSYPAVTDVGCETSISNYLVEQGIMRKGDIRVSKTYGDHGNVLAEQKYLTADAVSNMRNTLFIKPSFTDDRYCAVVRDITVAGASNHSMLKLITGSISHSADFGSYSCTNNYGSTLGRPARVGAADKMSMTFSPGEWQSYIVSCTALDSDLPGQFNVRHDYFGIYVQDGLRKDGHFTQAVVNDKDYCQHPDRWPPAAR